MGGSRLGTIGAVTGIGLLAIGFVGGWEGLRLYAYKDVVGVWTACYGETKGIKPGMRFTKEQCDEMFLGGLERHERALRRCLDAPDQVPEKTYVAFLSLAYNIGEGGFCRSSVVKRWNRGDQYGSCNAILMWNKAGGRVVQGLVNRRRAERVLCIDGLNEPVALPNPDDTLPADRPILRRGDRGFWVEHLQTALRTNDVDGQFGPATAQLVMDFQKHHGLAVDGVVGPETWAAIVEGK